LCDGADKARALAQPFMAELRAAVGLRNLAAKAGPSGKAKAAKAALPSFKQYREADGRHYFKLVDAAGKLLAQSTGFESPQQAGLHIAKLKRGDSTGLDECLQLADGATPADLSAALHALAQG
ncbi:MAG: tryptophan--tRNA ligase, partial [Ramlibacter sp.]